MATLFDFQQFLNALHAVQQFDPPDEATLMALSPQRKAKLLKAVGLLRLYLNAMDQRIEGIAIPEYTFDLSNPVTVGEMIVFKLEQGSKKDLSALPRFYGSGVYVLYYDGPFDAYEAIEGTDCPIYVGSASPKDKIADAPRKQGTALYERLIHHLQRSLAHARTTLDIKHFQYRYLVVQTGLELAAEQFLMRRYHPVWNKEQKVCPGFGKHGDQPDATAAAGGAAVAGRAERSRWDILHPGRPWAARQISRRGVTAKMVKEAIQQHFAALLRAEPKKWRNIFNAAWVARQTS